jgi:PPOX class probable FMN-dependent enzyme
MAFAEIITSEHELRAVMGEPMPRSVQKEISYLDKNCLAFIAKSPFVLVASCDAQGRLDVSPKGDPAGFVQVLDERTLAIPDRPGNQRADTFSNVLQNPRVGLLFLIPGKQETLRVNGRAVIVRDLAVRERMAVRGKAPQLALVVSVEEAFIHCTKCMLRSHLWEREFWPDPAGVPSQARFLVDHAKLPESVEQVQASLDETRKTRLY